jgi:hypothetical protein
MTAKKFVKAFIAGMALPAVFLPIAYSVLFVNEHHALMIHPIQFIPMYLPLAWGLANAMYVQLHGAPGKHVNRGLWITGICLGFVVAVYGVFVMHLPTIIFGVVHGYDYAPLIILPVVYGLLFRYVVKWLNKTLAV